MVLCTRIIHLITVECSLLQVGHTASEQKLENLSRFGFFHTGELHYT